MRDFSRLHPLVLYFVLACALCWGCIAVGFIARFHFWVPILGAFAPGVAAIVVSGLSSGEPGVRALLGKLARWRVGLGWYLVALGLPFAEDGGQLDRWCASCRVALACDPAAPSVREWRAGAPLVGVRLV